MNKEELKIRESELRLKHEKEILELRKEYAHSNNPYKIGDIVKDHIGAVLIETISYYLFSNESCCIYRGIELKKDLTPMKRQERREVYQSNIKEKIR